MDHPAKGTIFARLETWKSYSGVRRSFSRTSVPSVTVGKCLTSSKRIEEVANERAARSERQRGEKSSAGQTVVRRTDIFQTTTFTRLVSPGVGR